MPVSSRAELVRNKVSASEKNRIRRELAGSFFENQTDIYVLSSAELVQLWAAERESRGKSPDKIAIEFSELTGANIAPTSNGFQFVKDHGATAISFVSDSKLFTVLALDMRRSGNLMGVYHTTIRNGRTYIVFKGYPGLRNTLNGTRYLANNLKVVKMGIGIDGARHMAKQGAIVTLVISASLNGVQWLFDPRYGWNEFLGNVSSDIVKGFLAIGAGYLTQTAIAGAFSIAVFPVAAGITITLAIGYLLYKMDRHYDLTSKLIAANTHYYALWEAGATNAANTVNKTINQISQGVQKQRAGAREYIYAIVSDVGDSIVDIASREVRKKIDELARKFTSPGRLRF